MNQTPNHKPLYITHTVGTLPTGEFDVIISSWWFFEPTHLRKICGRSNWESFPQGFGVKIKNIWNLQLVIQQVIIQQVQHDNWFNYSLTYNWIINNW